MTGWVEGKRWRYCYKKWKTKKKKRKFFLVRHISVLDAWFIWNQCKFEVFSRWIGRWTRKLIFIYKNPPIPSIRWRSFSKWEHLIKMTFPRRKTWRSACITAQCCRSNDSRGKTGDGGMRWRESPEEKIWLTAVKLKLRSRCVVSNRLMIVWLLKKELGGEIQVFWSFHK